MKPFLLMVVVGLAMVGIAGGSEPAPVVFYVQLVRGTSESQPPAKDSKVIGPKLAAQFRVFAGWKHYWEIARQETRIVPGQKCRIKLNPEREVEIDLSAQGKRTITAYFKGQSLGRSTDQLDAPMTVIGGERDPRTTWFIAVRRDKPTTE
ncbi:MAG: hypothetical protein WCO56_02820 [Verrucomicrobiota bacterium]